MEIQHSPVIWLLGGIAVFMFGMSVTSDNLQKLAANRVRSLLAQLSQNKVLAVIVGVALTALLQSSGAVTSMLVGLGTAKVISLPQVMGVIIGTAIGSTLTVQLISFNITQFGLGIFFFSFMVYFLNPKRTVKELAGVAMGFGMVFFGLEMMSMGTSVFKKSEMLLQFMSDLKQNPLLAVIVTASFTAFIHSSAATIGLAMSLASAQILTLEEAMYWVYGANIGTCSTALMAAIGSNYIGKQVAWAHFGYKVGSVVLFMFFTTPFVEFLPQLSGDLARDVANGHTIFNIVSAIVFMPFIDRAATMFEKLIPKSAADQEFTTQYIRNESFNSPHVATAHAQRELLRMADIVQAMVRDSIDLFKGYEPDLEAAIKERDNQVDLLNREIKLYLVQLESQSGNLSKGVLELIDFASDLESAADVIDKTIVELARKKQNLKLEFSHEGWSEICEFHHRTVEICNMSISSFHSHDRSLARRTIASKRQLKKHERKLRESHLERLNRGLRESINTSAIHLDLLSAYRHVVGLVSTHAYNLIPERRSDDPASDGAQEP